MFTRTPTTRSLARWWLLASVFAALPVAAGRPGAMRFPSAGTEILSDEPALAWAPGELGVCACDSDAPVQTPVAEPGLATELFRGDYGALPVFAAESPSESFTSPRVTIGARAGDDKYALRLRGLITVPATGTWRFVVQADDGARLIVGSTTVLSVDGTRASAALVEGSIALTAGVHPFELQYFRNGLAGVLELRWAGPTIPDPSATLGDEQIVPDSAFSFVPAASTACQAAIGQPACTSNQDCAANAFCALTDGGGAGVCQLSSSLQLCADDAGCGRSSQCVTAQSVGGTATFEAAVQCPVNAPGCNIPGVAPGFSAGVVAEVMTNIQLDRLPNFNNLRSSETFVTSTFSIAAHQNTDLYAYRFRGFIEIPTTGSWTFSTISDDGSRLLIDGTIVVDNDGLHGALERSGASTLAAGRHAIEVQMFERFGGDSLSVTWAGPGIAKQVIPSAVLSHLPGDRVACTVSSSEQSCAPTYPGALPPNTTFEAERVQRVSLRGDARTAIVERNTFSVSPRLQYVVQVAQDSLFEAGSLLFESEPQLATTLPLTAPTAESINIRREPFEAQLGPSCGRVTLASGDSFEVLCSGSSAVTLPFNTPGPGTYTYRARVTGDQAGPDPVRVEVLVDGSLFRGVGAPGRPGIVDVTAARNVATQDIVFSVPLSGGSHSVTLRFANDFCCTPGDRNLLVDFVEVQGPAEAEVLLDALSAGDVFWRVVAKDGIQRQTTSAQVNLLAMPDSTPPQAPVVTYPAEGDTVLSQSPGVIWRAVPDAAEYEVRFASAAEQRTVTVRTTVPSLSAAPATFSRGDAVTIEVVAIDANGNASRPSTPVRIAVGERVRYEVEAFTAPDASAASRILSQTVSGTSFGPLSLPRTPPITISMQSNGAASSGSSCGVTGDNYVILCGQNNQRNYGFQVPEAATYAISVEAFENFARATVVGGEDHARMQVLVDGQPISIIEVASAGTFAVNATLTSGPHSLSLRFINDLCCTTGDRNLFVRTVTVSGPTSSPSFLDLLSVGPVFWRVTAQDGASRLTTSPALHLVGFPDETPPPAPTMIYPEDGAALVSLRPAFTWSPSPGAVEYRLKINDGTADVIDFETVSTSFDMQTDLERGKQYTASLVVTDAAGNPSEPVVRRFTISERVTYDFLAATSRSFSADSVVFQQSGLTENSLGITGLQNPTIDVTQQVEALEGGGCGTRFSARTGLTYQVLCNQNQAKTIRVRAPATGEYRVTLRASAEQAGPENARVRIAGRSESEHSIDAVFRGNNNNANDGIPEFQDIVVPVTLTAGNQSISFSFVNEFCCTPGDRNLLLDSVRIEGPIADTALSTLLSRGDIFWTVVARDGVQRSNQATNDFVVGFPDRLPPGTPGVVYPEVNAQVLAANPAIAWTSVTEAERYRVTIVDLGETTTQTVETTATTLQWPDALDRGASYAVSVAAVDAGGNVSEPSQAIQFTIASRVDYRLEVASSRGFEPENIVLERETGVSTKLGPLATLFTNAPVSQRRVAFASGVTGDNCGAVVAAGSSFATLCNQNHVRNYPLQPLAEAGEFLLTVEAYGVIVNGEGARMAVTVDGEFVDEVEVRAGRDAPQRFTFTRQLATGNHTVALRYTNELCCSPADRNLFVGAVSLEGPVGNGTLQELLARGDLFWRVTATDGTDRALVSSDTRVVGFPDETPPAAPLPVYPELAAEVLSQRPAFVWNPVADAASYRVRVVDTAGATVLERAGVQATQLDTTVDLTRGAAFAWTVTAVDAAGNESPATITTGFTVARRTQYRFEAATEPTFAEANVVARRENIVETRLDRGTTTAAPTNTILELELGEGLSCGTASDGGRTFVNLCSNGTRFKSLRVPSPGTYTLRARLSGNQTQPLATFGAVKAVIEVDGSPVLTRDVTSQFPASEVVTVNVELRSGSHTFGVRFVNDFCCTPTDRNFFADAIEVEGPVGNASFNDLLARGDIFWRVVAEDGAARTTRATQDHVVGFPDLFPPATPQLSYPAQGDQVLSARPAFAWSPAAEAANYIVVVENLDANTQTELGPTTATAIDWSLPDLAREARVRATVVAVDAAGNRSVDNNPVVFTVAPRLRYRLQAATSPGFETATVLLERDNLSETQLTTSEPVNPLVDEKREAESTAMNVRTYCSISGGYVNLCGSGSSVGSVFTISGARDTYELSFRAHAALVGAELSRVAILVDGVSVTTRTVFGDPTTPQTIRVPLDLRPGDHQISLRFENDFCCAVGDRNVFIDFLQLKGPVGASGASIDEALRVGPVFWRVEAVDGTSRLTSANAVHLVDFPDQTPPQAPLPGYPEDSATILGRAPGFTWSPIADAAGYRIVVVDQTSELELVRTDVPAPTTAVDGAALGLQLERGRRYRWFVEAVDAAGNRSIDSARRLFDVGSRLSYEVELATQPAFGAADIVFARTLPETTQLPLRTIDLPEAGTAFYRVTARDGAGREQVSSPLHMLNLPDTKPPAIVRVLYPDSGDEVLDATTGFAWAELEPDLEYEFEIATTNTFNPGTVLHAVRGPGTRIDLPDDAPLQPNNIYFWRVRAVDGVGNVGDYGIVRTLALRKKSQPIYTVELATQSFHLNPTPTFEGVTTATSLALPANRPLSQGTTYFWRVRADLTIESEPPITKTARSTEVLSMATGQFVPLPGGVIGTYFRDRTFTDAAAQRLDRQIDFPELADRDPFGDFGGLTGTNGDNFSVRWTGLVFAPRGGLYTFIGTADDTQLLIVDDRTLFSVTQFRGPSRQSFSIQLTEGWHTFVYEMAEASSSAFAQLSYACATCTPALPEQVIPPEFLAVPKDNTDRRPPQILKSFIASAMPATATTPARATLAVETDEPTVINVALTLAGGATQTIVGQTTRLVHEIPLGDVRGSYTYALTATDLNGNVTTEGQGVAACTPQESDLLTQQIRASFFNETNLTGRVLDELQSTIDYSAPSAPAQRLVGTNEYSVRFNGGYFVPAAEVGQHVLTSLADDGQRLTVNGAVVLNDFVRRSAAVQRQTNVELGAGWNEISFDLLQGLGNARARLAVTTPAGFTQTPISSGRLAAVNQAYLRPRFAAGAANVVIEAQTPQGSAAALATPGVTDCRDPRPRISSNAPAIFPLGTTNVAWTARNRFNEVTSLTQTVVVRDTTPPAIRPISDVVLQCVSPQQDGITDSRLLTPPTVRVTDNADVAPTVTVVLPPTFVLDQPTVVPVLARDASGNQSTSSFTVTTTDSAALRLAVDPQFSVGRADDCTRPDGSLGTRVVLPEPRVTNLCLASQEGDVTFTHNVGGPAQVNPEVCLPIGTSVATWTGRLGLRLGQASSRVTVVNSSFNVDVVAAPSGYRTSDAEVRLQLSCDANNPDCFAVADAAGVQRVQWRIEGVAQPTTTEVGADGSFVARFTRDVTACPLNVVVVDALGRQGSNRDVCFAIDRTAPTVETSALPTEFLASNDFTQTVLADINDPTTWPHVFIGEDLDMTIGATDALGDVDSGIREVSVTLRSLDDPGAAPTTIFAATPAAGTDALRSGPTAVQQVCVSPVCVAGKLDLARLGVGAWAMSVRARDVAGNTVSSERPFRIQNLETGLATVYAPGDGTTPDSGWIAASNVNRLTTSSAFRSGALRARASIVRAAGFLEESPPTTSLELFKAVTSLTPATSSVDSSPVRRYVSRAVRSEVRRLVELHAAAPMATQTWNVFGFGRHLSFDNPVGSYRGRQHNVSAALVLARAQATIATADNEAAVGRPNEGVRLSGATLDEMSVLLDDGVVAAFYGRAPHLIEAPSEAAPQGRAERLFLNAFATATDSDYGRELAQVVQQSISRTAAGGVQPQSLVASALRDNGECVSDVDCAIGESCLDGVCLETCVAREDCNVSGDVCVGGFCQLPGPFARVADRIEIFREGVDALDCRLDPNCGGRKLQTNLEFFSEIYMNVQDSFADLGEVQDATFSTHAWRQGIAMTLQYLLNFTVYTGEAPLVVLAPTDPVTAMTECWWHRMNEAMTGATAAGVDDAIDLFAEGRCLNVEIYNRFYGGEQVLPGDECVDPADFGCPSDGVRHQNAGRCLRVDPALMPTVTSMCGPLQ